VEKDRDACGNERRREMRSKEAIGCREKR
jgi:hypothetical protein